MTAKSYVKQIYSISESKIQYKTRKNRLQLSKLLFKWLIQESTKITYMQLFIHKYFFYFHEECLKNYNIFFLNQLKFPLLLHDDLRKLDAKQLFLK